MSLESENKTHIEKTKCEINKNRTTVLPKSKLL